MLKIIVKTKRKKERKENYWSDCTTLDPYEIEGSAKIDDLYPMPFIPIINSPISFSFTEGEATSGDLFSWIAADDNPSFYQIYKNDKLNTSGSWRSRKPIYLMPINNAPIRELFYDYRF